MSYKNAEYERISDENARIHDELQAVLGEHLPPEVLAAFQMKLFELEGNNFEMADYNDKRLYRALMGFIPEHYSEVRAAFTGICFDGSVCNEDDWLNWMRGVEWPVTPAVIDLLNGRQEVD